MGQKIIDDVTGEELKYPYHTLSLVIHSVHDEKKKERVESISLDLSLDNLKTILESAGITVNLEEKE